MSLQSQIDKLAGEITYLENEISICEGMTGTNIQACIDLRLPRLQSRLSRKTEEKAELESMQSALDYEWSSGEQVYLDDISSTFSGVYDKYMEGLKLRADFKDSFFSEYGNATNSLEKEMVLKAMLNL